MLEGYSLQALMMNAYDIDIDQIVGGPGWLSEDRYDLAAQVDGAKDELTDEQMRPLLRRLLSERFGLKTHADMREMSVYLLVQDPKGHRLPVHRSEEPSGMTMRNQNNVTKLVMTGYSMPKFARYLLYSVGRRVVDGTGLKGEYDMTLEWTDTVRSETGVSITTAIQEQLGLRLEQRKFPVEVHVVDSAQRPSEN